MVQENGSQAIHLAFLSAPEHIYNAPLFGNYMLYSTAFKFAKHCPCLHSIIMLWLYMLMEVHEEQGANHGITNTVIANITSAMQLSCDGLTYRCWIRTTERRLCLSANRVLMKFVLPCQSWEGRSSQITQETIHFQVVLEEPQLFHRHCQCHHYQQHQNQLKACSAILHATCSKVNLWCNLSKFYHIYDHHPPKYIHSVQVILDAYYYLITMLIVMLTIA